MQIFDPSDYLERQVTIIGLGTIGSWAALALAKLGIKSISTYEFDSIEAHNIPNQFYQISDLESPKEISLRNSLIDFSGIVINQDGKSNGKYENQDIIDILVVGVDSMEERRRICSALRLKETRPTFIIDGRIGGAQLEIYTRQSLDEWEETFVDNPSTDPCGARSVCYIGMIIGGLIANQVKRILRDEQYKKSILFDLNSLQIL